MIKSEDENRFVYHLLRNTTGNRGGGIGLHRKADNNFYGLMTAPRWEFEAIRTGKISNQITVEAMRILGILWKTVNGMMHLAQATGPLLSASGQFRQGKLQTCIPVDYFSEKWYGREG